MPATKRTPLSPKAQARHRAKLFLAAVCVAILGLASRRYPILFPQLFGNYPGDALWATFVFLGWSWLFPRATLLQLSTAAIASSVLVELSQLFHWPWLVSIRQTQLGRIALGNGFDPVDLLAYLIGVAIGAGLVQLIRASSQPK